jgi:hypothetical protein
LIRHDGSSEAKPIASAAPKMMDIREPVIGAHPRDPLASNYPAKPDFPVWQFNCTEINVSIDPSLYRYNMRS